MTRSVFFAAVVIALSNVVAWGQLGKTLDEPPAAAVATPPNIDRLVYSARTSPAQARWPISCGTRLTANRACALSPSR